MMIFIDTSALYALMDADDRNHERARDAWPSGWISRYSFSHRTTYCWKAWPSFSTGSASRPRANSTRS